MKIDNENIFATTLHKFEFNNQEMQPLLEEVDSKQNIIKKTSSFYTEHHSDNYFTDYKNPTKLHQYEILINMVANKYSNEGYSFNLFGYWTAIYGKNSIHNVHQHDTTDVNFSSILYLTNGGATSFLSSNSTATQREHHETSTVGKLIIFPSSLWHYASYKDESERIIISSNMKIIGNNYV